MLGFLRLCGSFPFRGRFPHGTFERSWQLGLWCLVRFVAHGTLQALQLDRRFHVMQVSGSLAGLANSSLTFMKDAVVLTQTLLLATRSSRLVDVLSRMKSLGEECRMGTADFVKDPMFVLTFLLSSGLCIWDMYEYVSMGVYMVSKGQWQWAVLFAMARQTLSFTVLPVVILVMHTVPKFLSLVTRATVPAWHEGPLNLAWHGPKGMQNEAADKGRERGSAARTVSLSNNGPPLDSFFTQVQARLTETEETFFRFVDYIAPVMLLFCAGSVIIFTSLLYLLYEDSAKGTADWFKIYATLAGFLLMVQPCLAADAVNREVNKAQEVFKGQSFRQ